MKHHPRLFAPLALFASALLLLSGCDQAPAEKETKKRPPKVHLVETAEARLDTLAYRAVRSGTLRARREVRLFTQEEGRIDLLPFFEGDRVEAGTVLARLDDTLLRAELDKAQARRRQAELDLKRQQGLSAKRLAAEEELARARTALQVAQAEEALLRTRLGYAAIRAPFTGIVTQRLAEPGDVAPRHTHLLTLMDPGSLLLEAGISALLIPVLAEGDAVAMTIDALGAVEHRGVIRRIHPTVDPATRRARVEIALDPVPEGARPGQLARVRLTGETAQRLVVPFHALQRDADGEFLFVVDGEGKARRRAVLSGLRLAERVVIDDGLSAGEAVVVKGFLGLTDGTAVQEAGAKKKKKGQKPGNTLMENTDK